MITCNPRLVAPIAVLCMVAFGLLFHNYSRYNIVQLATELQLSQLDTAPLDSNPQQKKKDNFLDGCYHVYLDVGSNVGVQVRKLFQPKLYPDAAVHKVFNEFFGGPTQRDTKTICAVGFEPNPNHEQRLKDIEENYAKCGWRAKFYTRTAVSNQDGKSDFFTDNAMGQLEWGAGIVESNNNVQAKKNADGQTVSIDILRLSSFINDVVAAREIPRPPSKYINGKVLNLPKVVMKLDIEGSEVEVLPDLAITGAMEHINVIMAEWHTRLAGDDKRRQESEWSQSFTLNLAKLTESLESSPHIFKSQDLDDESYMNSEFEFPKCSTE